ncbi:hypothetical protein Leryth_027379 [Lithospermum erythrorhizon]|nr:hypothetical protein Leryth_027379 [Lithospermum erythrorhizon]
MQRSGMKSLLGMSVQLPYVISAEEKEHFLKSRLWNEFNDLEPPAICSYVEGCPCNKKKGTKAKIDAVYVRSKCEV